MDAARASCDVTRRWGSRPVISLRSTSQCVLGTQCHFASRVESRYVMVSSRRLVSCFWESSVRRYNGESCNALNKTRKCEECRRSNWKQLNVQNCWACAMGIARYHRWRLAAAETDDHHHNWPPSQIQGVLCASETKALTLPQKKVIVCMCWHPFIVFRHFGRAGGVLGVEDKTMVWLTSVQVAANRPASSRRTCTRPMWKSDPWHWSHEQEQVRRLKGGVRPLGFRTAHNFRASIAPRFPATFLFLFFRAVSGGTLRGFFFSLFLGFFIFHFFFSNFCFDFWFFWCFFWFFDFFDFCSFFLFSWTENSYFLSKVTRVAVGRDIHQPKFSSL